MLLLLQYNIAKVVYINVTKATFSCYFLYNTMDKMSLVCWNKLLSHYGIVPKYCEGQTSSHLPFTKLLVQTINFVKIELNLHILKDMSQKS